MKCLQHVLQFTTESSFCRDSLECSNSHCALASKNRTSLNSEYEMDANPVAFWIIPTGSHPSAAHASQAPWLLNSCTTTSDGVYAPASVLPEVQA